MIALHQPTGRINAKKKTKEHLCIENRSFYYVCLPSCQPIEARFYKKKKKGWSAQRFFIM